MSYNRLSTKSLQLYFFQYANFNKYIDKAIIIRLVKPAFRIDEKYLNTNGKWWKKTGRLIDEKSPNFIAKKKNC